ncbi:MAG: phage head morphogenesis protein [Proteobacteria bacterium]|nr:phage head morphogenesis protein [Pseudomonadota bacterium]MBU1387101.1 phage head morphogenesis protein [Pseudomonadota bacterium]MBU1541582.1 phage head morphogenesis protein [Pseudomonadota bacterium]MBU2429528.1 phage head morphogenesis protein [Pseudomonadota bacterium]MBU2482539.1 phage head morphogenesis protein [Pseudomonadota bacterium]
MNDILQIYGGKPFDEAIAFFRAKLNIPSKHWDDLWTLMHTKAFTVAGAMQEELLNDLRTAVDKAISEGTTLAQFRKDFGSIVEQYGWVHKGGRNWRSKVIYDTNLRTAYQAGRYQQMTDPDVVALRPYWQYQHGGSVNPREEHLAWDGMILPHDDPFWNTHYPPNGWGCKCRVVTLSQRDLEKQGRQAPDTAPKIEYRTWEDSKGNKHQVPVGIDPGWDYNVGQGKNFLNGA